MSSSGKYPGNGASLEDCHTNIFALADLNGLKWKAFVYYHHHHHNPSVNSGKGESGDAWSSRTDPLLTSYVKCLSAGVLAVWRLKPNPSDAPASAHDAGAGARARSFDSYCREARELWIFWHGDDPDFVDLLSPELTNFESGTWDNGIAYECRTLLFKSFHNVIERYLIMHGFIRLGKWFLEPHVYDKNLENRKHLAFSFSFFLHGESAICTSLDIKQLPAIFRLDNKLLGISQNSSEPVKVILSPFALSGTLTGKSFKENDPGIRDLILGWDLHYPYSYHKPKSGDAAETPAGREPSSNIPKVLEVCAGGFTMSYPACHIFVAEGDNNFAEGDKASRYSISGDKAPTPSTTSPVAKEGSELSGPIGLFPARPFWTVGHNSNYGQLSPPESPLANNHSVTTAGLITTQERPNHLGPQDSFCLQSFKVAPEDGFERSWAESLSVDHTLASTATQQNYCRKCLDCELRAMNKMPKNDLEWDYKWDFQNPGSLRPCECQKNQCQGERSFAPLLPSNSFSTRKFRPKTTSKSRAGTRIRARPYNVFGPAGDGQAAFHKRRRPSVTYTNHSKPGLDEMPKPQLARPDPPGRRPTDKTKIDGQMNQIPRPEPVSNKHDPLAPLKMPGTPNYDSPGAAPFKDTLLKETLLDIVHKRQQSHARPGSHLDNNSNPGRADRGPLNFESFYVPLGRNVIGTGQLMSKVPLVSSNPTMLQPPAILATSSGHEEAVRDSLQENNQNLAQLMAKPHSQQSHENTSRSLEERMFDPYEFNDDFNHANPKNVGPNPGQAPNPTPRFGAQKVTGTGSVGDITAQPYGNVKAEVKEEQSASGYDQNIFHTLNQYSNSLMSQRTANTMDNETNSMVKETPSANPLYPCQEVEDVKKWDGTQQALASSKALSLSLNFSNPALGSVSLNTLLGAPPINPGILTSSDLSRIFPTPPSLENNNLYSPCGNIAVPPPLGTVPPLDGSSFGISVSGTGVCQGINAGPPYPIDSTSPTSSGQVVTSSNTTTQPEPLSLNVHYNDGGDAYVPSQQQQTLSYGNPTIELFPSSINHHSSLELLKKSLDSAAPNHAANASRLEWFRNKVRARSGPTSALQLKLNRLNAVVDQYYMESISSNKGEMESFDANVASTKSFQPLALQSEPTFDRISTGTDNFKYVPASCSMTNRPISASKSNDSKRTFNSVSDYAFGQDKFGPGLKPDNSKDLYARTGAYRISPNSSSSLSVNLILSASTAPGINYFSDTNFDACPLCVCNMTIRDDLARDRLNQMATSPLTFIDDWVELSLTKNFPALAALYKEHSGPKAGPGSAFSQQHSHNCMCGFNGAVNRIKAFGAGLFYEDEMEITNSPGPKSLYALFNLTPPPTNPTKLYNNAKSQMDAAGTTTKMLPEGNRGAAPYPQARRDYLLELAYSQGALCPIAEPLSCLINQATTCDRPEALTRARPYYYNARLYLDQCKIGLIALGIGSGIFGDIAGSEVRRPQQANALALLTPPPKLGWRSALNILFTMHLWPHYQNSENLSSEDTLVTLRSLRPLIQDAILKKGGVRSCLFEHAYNISGPLTWQQFHKLTGRGNEERCEPQPLPLILTGYEHERLSLSPLAINFWEYLHVEPYSLPKDIAYVAIIPDDECLIALATTFFENLNATYEVCKLGRHLPLSRIRDGLLKIGVKVAKSYSDNTLNNWNYSFGKSCWEKKLKLYALAIKNQLGPLLATAPLSLNIPLTFCPTTLTHPSGNQCETSGSEINATGPNVASGQGSRLPPQQQGSYVSQNGYNTPGGHINQTHQQPGDESGLKYAQPYIGEPESAHQNNEVNSYNSSTQPLDPPNNATASNNIAVDKSTSDNLSIVLYLLDPFSIFPPHCNNNRDTTLNTSFAKYFTLGLTKAYTDMIRELPDDVRGKITLKILPLQTLIQAGNSRFERGDSREITHVSNHYRTFALSIYSQIRYVVPCDKPSQSYTGFGPGVHKNSIIQKNQASGYNHNTSPSFYAPPYVLAPQQNSLPDYGQILGRKPKIPPAHHSYGPKSGNGLPNPTLNARESCAVLFCGYCLSHDQKWLLATATDGLGQTLDACFINMDTPNRFRKKKGALQRAVLKKLWDFVVKIVSGTNTMWRITIGRFGRIGHGELKVWSSLLSKRSLQRCNAELRDCCRACSIVPLNAQPATEQPGRKIVAPGVAILSACLISLDLNTNFNVMANSVAPELDRMGYSKLCPLTTPKDVSCTHILVFPLSATAQPSGTDNREEDVAMEDLVGRGRGRNDATLNPFSLGGGASTRHDDLLDDVIASNPRDPSAIEGGTRCSGGGNGAGGDHDEDDDDLLLLNAFSDLPIDQFLIDVDDVMMMEEDGGGGGGAEESNPSSFASTGLHHGAPHHHHGNQHPHAMMASTTNHAKPAPSQHRPGGLGLVGPHHHHLAHDQSNPPSNHVTAYQNGALVHTSPMIERRKRHSGLEYSDEPIMLLQQPLALGYYVSTAKIGPLPYWFYSANHFIASENRPSFLNAALHINCASVIHSNDDLFSHTSFKSEHKNHPLDSDQTTDILRYVLEGYNRLSWLVMDPSTRDRVSCLPLHLQILLNIYHMLATYS